MKRLAEHHHILRITPLHRPPQRLKLVRTADAQGINSTSCSARSIQLYRILFRRTVPAAENRQKKIGDQFDRENHGQPPIDLLIDWQLEMFVRRCPVDKPTGSHTGQRLSSPSMDITISASAGG